MLDVLNIAKYVITSCLEQKMPISNLKLQKILYFIQGKSLVTLGRPAFEKDILAWKFGPVVPNVYFEFASYASAPILRRYEEIEIEDAQLRKVIDDVITEKKAKTAWDLVRETHAEGTPWEKFYNENESNIVIPKEEIMEFFSK